MDKRKILIFGLVVVTIMMSSFTFYFYQTLYSPNFLIEKESRYLYIPSGAAFSDVQSIVYDEGFVNEPISFGMLSKLMDYDELVKPGRYLIDKNATNLEVIRKLRSGAQDPVRITFNNARLLAGMAEKLTVNLELNSSDFLELLVSDSIVRSYGFDHHTFRSMFIPDTYEVYWTISGMALLDRMHKEYERFWNDERMAKAKALDMTPVEVTILASIVQAETAKADESPVVAGLYLNRLKRGMALQADPTLVFAAGDFSIKRVLNIHKTIDSPYNTYKYAGLHPDPSTSLPSHI